MYNLRNQSPRSTSQKRTREKTPTLPGRSPYRSRSQGRSPSRSVVRSQTSRSSVRTRGKSKDRKSVGPKIEVVEIKVASSKTVSEISSVTERASRSSSPKRFVDTKEAKASALHQDVFPLEGERTQTDMLAKSGVDDGSESDFSAKTSSTRSIRVRNLGSYIASSEDVSQRESTPTAVKPRMSEILQRELTPTQQIACKFEGTDEDKFQKVVEWRKRNIPTEFGGCLGSLALMILLPFGLLALHILPTLSINSWPDYADWMKLFNLEVIAIYSAFEMYVVILSLLPLGKNVEALPDKVGRYYYRCNGFIVCSLTVITLGIIHYYSHPVTMVYDKYIQFLVTAILCGVLLAVGLFVRGGRASPAALNPCGNSNSVVYDFWMGRELNPRIGNLDLKMTFLKISLVTNVVLYAIIILKSLENEEEWNVALYTTVFLQAFYVLQCLWFEELKISSFHVLYEGVGYMTVVGSFVYPFITTLITKYLLEQRQEHSSIGISYSLLMSLLGYYIYFTSNLEKHNFRMNPVRLFLDVPAINTTRGKKLMTGGWWGFVRHPNYLGDIILHWAWIGCCGFDHWLPYTVPIFTTVLLMHRAKRDEARCRLRYGAAYEKYCETVKFSLVPKLF
ncbi:delta(14)-sterol reductase TM7SF2 [Anabrus simplex]|uniref:delta(14)-sterol reductase TM7SF2 n=1 Tax=Anabrus simplex TaxID=316456 RepID=UPI0034DDB6D4